MTARAVWPISSTSSVAVSWSSTWLIVTREPISIKALITSAALTDIANARSATEIVSGMATSCTTGAVGRSNACWPAAVEVSFLRAVGLGLRRPRLPATTCNSSRLSTRSLVRLRFGLSSRSAAGASFGAPASAPPAVSGTTSPAVASFAALDASNSAATRSASAAFSAAAARSRASASTFAFTAASFSAAARSTSSFWRCRSPRRTKVRRFFTSTWTVLGPPVREV